jgi:hypothetical protein
MRILGRIYSFAPFSLSLAASSIRPDSQLPTPDSQLPTRTAGTQKGQPDLQSAIFSPSVMLEQPTTSTLFALQTD